MSTMVECPLCERFVPETFINAHIDSSCSAFLSTSSASSTNLPLSTSNVIESGGVEGTVKKKRKLGNHKEDSTATSSVAPPINTSSSSSPILSRNGSTTSSTTKRTQRANEPSSTTSSLQQSKPRSTAPLTTKSHLNSVRPLPDLVRPQSLQDFIGQRHLLGEGMLLRGLIEKDRIGSCLFWGPPGTGKTTIARVIAQTTSSIFKELSATNATTADLRKCFEEASNVLKLTGKKTVLFIDEIQRFNKGLQDLFLPVVESGQISLIASTTENPSFKVNSALLSRCRVFVLEKLTSEDVYRILVRGLKLVAERDGKLDDRGREKGKGKGKEKEGDFDGEGEEKVKIEEEKKPSHSPPSTSSSSNLIDTSSSTNTFSNTITSERQQEEEDLAILSLYPSLDQSLLQFLASAADGDARVALSSLELALSATATTTTTTEGVNHVKVDREELKKGLRKAHLQYDRSGDHHYDTISALHKSIRGSDANAALYWLARMLEGGDDPLYVARRLIRMASEDVGLANPQALGIAMSAFQATQVVGMPECDCILAQVVVMLAESPKSIRTYSAYKKAKSLVRDTENYPVPLHIRNAPTKLMKELGYGRDYRYDPSFAHPVYQPFLPQELVDNPSANFLQDDESIEGKTVDEVLLREWEMEKLGGGGEKWEGRKDLERKVEELEKLKAETKR